jgi:hypothetical protein
MKPDADEFDLPADLARALRSAYTHPVAIPTAVDQVILAAAREKFDRRRRMRLLVRWGSGAAAAIAATIALAVILHRPPQSATAPAIAKGDVNGDGRVNMVDAMLLAKHVRDHDAPQPTWDVNGDGAVDAKDADVIASAAVSLKQGGLATRALPKMTQLGLARPNVGLASASGTDPGRSLFALTAPRRLGLRVPLAETTPALSATARPAQISLPEARR